MTEYDKQYYIKNREKILLQKKEFYINNKDVRRDYQTLCNERNRETIRIKALERLRNGVRPRGEVS